MSSDSEKRARGDSGIRVHKVGRGTRVAAVYHYTNAAGLIGVVESGLLWATSYQALNDTSELRYAVDLIRAVVPTLTLNGPGRAVATVTSAVHSLMQEVLKRDFYVVSASRERDLLNQWMHYSGSGGYAIGLAPGVMAQLVSRQADDHSPDPLRRQSGAPIWVDVTYREDEQRDLIRDTLQEVVTETAETGSDDESHLFSVLGMLMAQIKHPAFEAEKEARLLVDRTAFTEVQFRVGRTGMPTPYISVGASAPVAPGGGLPLSLERGQFGKLPIKEIVLGPAASADTQRHRAAVDLLLSRHRHDVPVTASSVPFMSWAGRGTRS